MTRQRDGGFALLLALFVLFLVGLAASLLALALQHGFDEQQRSVVRLRLDLLNDAVTAETLGELAEDPSFAGVALLEIGAGSATSRVESAGEVDGVTVLQVKTEATFGASRRRTSTRVWFTESDLTLSGP